MNAVAAGLFARRPAQKNTHKEGRHGRLTAATPPTLQATNQPTIAAAEAYSVQITVARTCMYTQR